METREQYDRALRLQCHSCGAKPFQKCKPTDTWNGAFDVNGHCSDRLLGLCSEAEACGMLKEWKNLAPMKVECVVEALHNCPLTPKGINCGLSTRKEN